jgi:hypothetical protein
MKLHYINYLQKDLLIPPLFSLLLYTHHPPTKYFDPKSANEKIFQTLFRGVPFQLIWSQLFYVTQQNDCFSELTTGTFLAHSNWTNHTEPLSVSINKRDLSSHICKSLKRAVIMVHMLVVAHLRGGNKPVWYLSRMLSGWQWNPKYWVKNLFSDTSSWNWNQASTIRSNCLTITAIIMWHLYKTIG